MFSNISQFISSIYQGISLTVLIKGFKFRIYPNKEQKDLLSRSFGSTRFIWNQILGRSIRQYQAWKENNNLPKPDISYSTFNHILNELKTEHAWLYDVSSVSLQQKTRDLVQAFSNFFRELKKGKVAYPKFKRKIIEIALD